MKKLQTWYSRQSSLVQTVVDACATLAVIALASVPAYLISAERLFGRHDELSGDWVFDILMIVVVAPLTEEPLLRGIPLWLYHRWEHRLWTHYRSPSPSTYWALGLPSSYIFAILHGSGFAEFPVPQFILGLSAWRVGVRRGLRHSILLHAVFNALVLVIAVMGSEGLGV